MMRALCLAELEAPLQGQLLGEDREFSRVSTDSRSLQTGDLFVALAGDNFDGHNYLQQVAENGAAAALVSQSQTIDLPQLQVADTLQGLGRLGAYNRQLYRGPLVAITGSSGKTTVKNMVQAVLSTAGNTLATSGNLNNEVGVPLTLLRLEPAVEYAVVEMGAAKAGDIQWLCELGRPSVSLLLNAMPAHLEGFGSVDDVAQAKGEIFDGLQAGDVALINADQPWAAQWRRRAGEATVLDFGLEQSAAITASAVQSRGVEGVSFITSTPAGDLPVRLSLPGVHNVANALAAIAVGLACQLSLSQICQGLESVRPVAGRLRSVDSASGAKLIDDCYNANPGSVRAAIDLLASCEGRRTLMLGAMKELGERSAELHLEIGEYAREAGIDQLWGVGEELRETVQGFGDHARHFADRESLVTALQDQFGDGDSVLVKGSRSAGMEQVLQALAGENLEGDN
jgi:UDP-N-acetylmuramoyl-tripeptide--D-alanyl-D-alanine ligase